MEEASTSLYQDWQKLYPRYQTGFFRTLRWGLTWFLLGIWMALPLIRWSRPGDLPNQAVLFDLPGRKFYIFDLIIWPQEVYLLAILLIVAAVALFFITTLAGRVFCGFMCFQTVWTDLFLYVEEMFEGHRKQRMRLDQSPWGTRKLLVKLGKHLTWLLISLATGGFFVFYFADAPTLMGQLLDGSAPMPAWITVLILTSSTYLMAGFAREQVCIYMCPYSRFQGAMFDEDTIIIAYHPELGEPRQGNRRVRQQEKGRYGLCIDCQACVTVCPTGIDIREGQQYQCITCGACVDACNDIKNRLHLDHELIRYTSMREMKGQPTRFFRFRVLAYGVIMVILLAGVAGHFLLRAQVDLSVIRQRQPLFITMSDGGIQNNYTLRVMNLTSQPQRYRLALAGLAGAGLQVATVTPPAGGDDPVLQVGPGEVMPFAVYVRQPRELLAAGPADIRFVLTAEDQSGGSNAHATVFARP